MTVLIKILSIAGWLLLAAVLLAAWVILMPRHFFVEYSTRDGLIVEMNIAAFRITLYPVPSFLQKFINGKKTTEKQEFEFSLVSFLKSP